MHVRNDEDPYVHSELFRRVSEGLIDMDPNEPEDYDGYVAYITGHAPGADGATYVDEAETVELRSGEGPKPIAVLRLPQHYPPLQGSVQQGIAEVPAKVRRVVKLHNIHRDPSVVGRLVRLCEEMLESGGEIDLRWYSERLNEIKAEINGP